MGINAFMNHPWNELAFNTDGIPIEEYEPPSDGEYPAGLVVTEWMYSELENNLVEDPWVGGNPWVSYDHEILCECLWGMFDQINFFGGIPS